MIIRRLKRNNGTSTIEFAIGFIFFWYMCAAWVEMSLMSYISAVGDVAISHSAQVAKKYSGTGTEAEVKAAFLTAFKTELDNGSLWRYVVDANDFILSVEYIKSYSDLVNITEACLPKDEDISITCGDATDSALAIYRVNYNYTPIFNYFINSEQMFSREVIVIQEYQRDKF
jgi:tight adherence protein E